MSPPQPDLFGPAVDPDGPHSLFFALLPDADLRERIAAATAGLHAPEHGGRRLRPARYHLTLQYLGQFDRLPPSLPERAQAAAATLDAAQFDLVLDLAASFHARRHTWWLGCRQPPPALEALWTALGAALARAGIRPVPTGSFTPHVTIVRDAHRGLGPVGVESLPWPVRGFALLCSSGPHHHYSVLGEWPLHPAPAGPPA